MTFLKIYSQPQIAANWLDRFAGKRPLMALVLGFTETGLLPGISAAGLTPSDRYFTALADAEFLHRGPQASYQYALPPLQAGASPTLITKAVLSALDFPLQIFNAGLCHPPSVPCISLEGQAAACLQGGQALPYAVVQRLWQQGLAWGERLAQRADHDYLLVGECVVGGTTTALAVLLGLGIDAANRVNSSHPICNHQQKLAIAETGLAHWRQHHNHQHSRDPLALIAAVGDPMQPVVAGMALAASHYRGIMLAGGTQMLAVYALMQALATYNQYPWRPEQVIVGTTGWVAEDPTGDTPGLANQIKAALVAPQLSFAPSHYPQLRAYEQGFVKEGVGAGACLIAAHLHRGWEQQELLKCIEQMLAAYSKEATAATSDCQLWTSHS
jgi:uncharacterized protein (TIGR00303 family)